MNTPDLLIGFGAGILLAAGMELAGAFNGIKGAAKKAVQLYLQYEVFLFILSLFFLIPKLLNSCPKSPYRTFQLIKLTRGVNLMLVKRCKIERYDSSFDPDRPFQYHVHEGLISLYVQFDNFIVFASEEPLTAKRAWGSKGVTETALTSNLRRRKNDCLP